MKRSVKMLGLLIGIAFFSGCAAEQNTLKVKFNTSVSDGRVFEFKNIENDQLLKAAISSPFQIKQNQKEIPSQLFFDPVSKTHSLLIYPAIDNKSTFTFTPGIKPALEFEPMAHAELWHKTGGKFVDRKYVDGGPFIEVDSIRVPSECTDHSFYIKYEGPGWESNLVGYRFYLDWRNANDVYGKKTEKMILEGVGQDGYESYHNMQDWGMDNFKVGATLGIGSIAYWNGKSAERVAVTDSVICKILSKGPLRAAIQTNYYGWKTNDFKTNMTSFLTIDANTRLTKEVLVFDKAPANICTGIIKDTTCEYVKITEGNWTAFGDWGKQSLNKDNLGLVIFVKNSSIVDFKTDDLNYAVVLKPENNQATWYFGATWELEAHPVTTIDQYKAYIKSQLLLLNDPDSKY
ncbi:MAG TPA: DUF4861 family protein [Prolixibacteraceae bacterium]|nr:DUF4861 family protein [Prolixibacteraceae bacterium]HPS12517.1 DUF4861 family protein [Prolixibacteraceae bacterium]